MACHFFVRGVQLAQQSLRLSCSRTVRASRAAPQPNCAFSTMAHARPDLFNYTSGRWIFNETLRLAERRHVFNIDGLCKLAAQSVDRSPDDIVDLKKLAEGGFNRSFLLTMRDGFQMVARIPYPATIPKYFTVASEVATMAYLRLSGLPIPQIYGYSPVPNNAAETEYVFMEFLQGINLSDIWFDLGEEEISSVLQQLVELESKMMKISFPAGGSLYYAKDLEKATGERGIPLKDSRFCIGPDTRLSMWAGKRWQLDVNRGPYQKAEAALVRGAEKELAYLEKFGRPLLPFQRIRRETYQYQDQMPSDHAENLNRYLLVAPYLNTSNPATCHFSIRHPDLQPGNIIVSRSSNSNLNITSMIDWQHTPILPLFLLAGIPGHIQNYADPFSDTMTQPVLPENLEELNENKQSNEKELYRRRLVHFHYVKKTLKSNILHYVALTDSASVLRRKLFTYSSNRWDGETLNLKAALIDATNDWDNLTGGGVPCPIAFDAEDVRKTMELSKKLEEADDMVELLQRYIGYGEDGWVPTESYERVMDCTKEYKESALAEAESDEERDEIMTHWLWDDMDEDPYA